MVRENVEMMMSHQSFSNLCSFDDFFPSCLCHKSLKWTSLASQVNDGCHVEMNGRFFCWINYEKIVQGKKGSFLLDRIKTTW